MKTKKEIEALINELQEEKKDLRMVNYNCYREYVKECLPLEEKNPELFKIRNHCYLENSNIRIKRIEKIDNTIYTLEWVLGYC